MIQSAEVLFSSDGGLFKDYPLAGSASAARATDATGNLAARGEPVKVEGGEGGEGAGGDRVGAGGGGDGEAPLVDLLSGPTVAAAEPVGEGTTADPFGDEVFDEPATPTRPPSDVAV